MPKKSLFGDIIEIKPEKEKVKRLVKKIAKPKTVSAEAAIKSKTVSIPEKLELINKEVDRILGVYKNDTVLLNTLEDFIKYIDECIKNKIIVVDTETNNSLDPLTCKLMGLCLYTPGQKNAYVPVNHTDLDGNKLVNQITEQQIHDQLERVMKYKECKFIFHNAKFDYKVIFCTCGIALRVDWDTLIGCKLLNENEEAKLKTQYITKIDPTIEKYSIDHLFNIEYKYVDPSVFALYAATDSFMTYKLYLYQLAEFNKPENEGMKDLLYNVEIPIIEVVAKMELRGICVDKEYTEKISPIYHQRSDAIQKEIDDELVKLKPKIDAWRLTTDATAKPMKKSTVSKTLSGIKYQYDPNNKLWINTSNSKSLSEDEIKELKLDKVEVCGKSKSEQLSDPPELSSTTQLAIILYDIIKCKVVDKDMPRGTGAEILEKLADDIPLCNLLLKKRGVDILINTFIDKMPELIKENTGRLHASFNTYGAGTGRFSSSDPNLQNIPSHQKDIRLIFKAEEKYNSIEENNNSYTILKTDEVEVDNNKWILASDLKVGDTLLNSEGYYDTIKNINEDKYYIIVNI